jgi:hypothetical protein
LICEIHYSTSEELLALVSYSKVFKRMLTGNSSNFVFFIAFIVLIVGVAQQDSISLIFHKAFGSELQNS